MAVVQYLTRFCCDVVDLPSGRGGRRGLEIVGGRKSLWEGTINLAS